MKPDETNIDKGSLLISAPQLTDFFSRTVILMMEHNESGSLGFVINKPIKQKLNEVIDGFNNFDAKVFLGGPVETEMINFIHRAGNIIEGGLEIFDGVFWGGNFEKLKFLAEAGELNPNDFIFLVGYSGWSEGQLIGEMTSNTWFVSKPEEDLIFDLESERIWTNALRRMGGEYLTISSFPSDPTVN
jgi:putative transcriptional regulator